MKSKIFQGCLFLISALYFVPCSYSEKSSVAGEEPIKLLIVDGFSNHDWQHTTRCLLAILGKTEIFDLSVSTFPVGGAPEEIAAWDPRFSDYDVVIQTCNDLRGGPQWPRSVEETLEAFVRKGGGLYVYHAGNNAFPHWKVYNQLIGLGWRDKDFGWALRVDENENVIRIPAGEGQDTGHGQRYDATLIRMGDHPIHEGFPRQWIAADIEVYRYARGPAENLTVLSYSKDRDVNLFFPIEWVVDYGKGKVYNSTLGHVWKNQNEPEGIRCAGFQTLIPRVLQWLAGREVDTSIPDDFPATSAQLRSYAETMSLD